MRKRINSVYELFSTPETKLKDIKKFVDQNGWQLIVLFLCQIKVFKNPGNCKHCGGIFTNGKVDEHYWYCPGRSCRGQISVRTRSVLSGSKLSMMQWFDIVMHYLSKSSHTAVKKTSQIDSLKTIKKWFDRFDSCLHNSYVTNGKKMGGKGTICELDETCVGKLKYGRGKFRDDRWVFGIVQRYSGKSVYVEVPNRTQNTLLKIIFKYVDHSTIMSDGWASYHKLTLFNYKHGVVNSNNYCFCENVIIHFFNSR